MKSIMSILMLAIAMLAAVPVAAQPARNFYVATTQDVMVLTDAQRFFANRMKATVTEIAASHTGLISRAAALPIESAAR